MTTNGPCPKCGCPDRAIKKIEDGSNKSVWLVLALVCFGCGFLMCWPFLLTILFGVVGLAIQARLKGHHVTCKACGYVQVFDDLSIARN